MILQLIFNNKILSDKQASTLDSLLTFSFCQSLKSLITVDAASVAETDQAEHNIEEDDEEKIDIDSSDDGESDETAAEKKKKKRMGFRDRKVSFLYPCI